MVLAMNCPEGMNYSSNGDPCQPTCTPRSVAELEDCDGAGKVEMCVCKPGYKLDEVGCIPKDECPGCKETGDVYKVRMSLSNSMNSLNSIMGNKIKQCNYCKLNNCRMVMYYPRNKTTLV